MITLWKSYFSFGSNRLNNFSEFWIVMTLLLFYWLQFFFCSCVDLSFDFSHEIILVLASCSIVCMVFMLIFLGGIVGVEAVDEGSILLVGCDQVWSDVVIFWVVYLGVKVWVVVFRFFSEWIFWRQSSWWFVSGVLDWLDKFAFMV